jgi:hypothetical protein
MITLADIWAYLGIVLECRILLLLMQYVAVHFNSLSNSKIQMILLVGPKVAMSLFFCNKLTMLNMIIYLQLFSKFLLLGAKVSWELLITRYEFKLGWFCAMLNAAHLSSFILWYINEEINLEYQSA